MQNAQRKFIELTKVAASDSPFLPPADPESYSPGLPSASPPPLGHTIKGWLVSGPTIGEPLVIDRTERNGITVRGLFASSPVVTFDLARIQTVNSVYTWREIQPPAAHEDSSD